MIDLVYDAIIAAFLFLCLIVIRSHLAEWRHFCSLDEAGRRAYLEAREEEDPIW